MQAGFLAIIGMAVGSFLTLAVERLGAVESIIAGRSKCNHCKQELTWRELIPVASFFILKGRCRRCHKPIPKIYPLFELITAAAFVVIGLAQPRPINYIYFGAELIFVSLLLALLFCDWLSQTFPTTGLHFAIAGAVGLVLIRTWLDSNSGLVIYDSWLGFLSSPQKWWQSGLLGGIIGAGFLGLLAFPSKGKWMGFGDVFVGGAIGLWLGYPIVLVALVLAFYGGALLAIWQIVTKKVAADHRVAFGPFLIIGAVGARVWGEQIVRSAVRLWGGSL